MHFLTEQCHIVKFCEILKKSKVEMITPLEEVFQILDVSIFETRITYLEVQNRCPGDPGNPDDLRMHFKGV